ncbi:2-oxo-tetronate isomerase [Novispirillum itersonii]|uniref:2-oxo-tetronate isomerase n=1 Tax=Novispirillum itersonii TaxID=189 RepID=UPI000368FFCC|nr:2-oxo-tetronate isomerase [Novispirillum itersonii]
MPRFAANLSMLFTDLPFLDRFAAAAQAGFKGCEMQFPYLEAAEVVGDKAAMAGLKVAAFNAPPGDWAKGERGLAAVPGREDEFKANLELVVKYAEFLDCTNVHIMAGVVPEEQWDEALDTYLKNIAYAADELHAEGLHVLVEAINPVDMPDYFLNRPDDAARVIEELDRPNLHLLYDIYHAQMTQGNLTDFIEGNFEKIRHIQIAGAPGRHEPDQLGEINFRYLFDLLDSSGYDGWIGCEYKPRINTTAGLRWAKEWLQPKES